MRTKKPAINFTGERLVPELNKGQAFFYEHLVRYLFSAQFTKGKIVLDAGCGVGYGSFIVSSKGSAKKVLGVDISKEAIVYAKQKYPRSNLTFVEDSLESLTKVKDNSINIVLAFEVIEHLKDPEKFLETIKLKLKTNGLLLVSTPNKYTYPPGNPYHFKEYFPNEFVELLKLNFCTVKIFHQFFEFSQNIKEDKNKVFKLEEDFSEVNQTVFTPIIDRKKSQYLLAVCSDGQLPVFNTVSINSHMVEGFDLQKGMLSLLSQNQVLISQIQKLTEKLSISEKIILDLKNELVEIKSSKTFKLRQTFHKIKNTFKKKVV